MKCYELTSSQFADRTGIQRASVSHIISGRNKPSLEVMQKIYEAFPELDLKWLMTGVGEEPVAGKYGGNDTAMPGSSGSETSADSCTGTAMRPKAFVARTVVASICMCM